MFVQRPIDRETAGEERHVLLCGNAAQLPALDAYAGQVQCVYLDPPYLSGKSYGRKRPFGEAGWRSGSPVCQFPGYEDQLSREAYTDMLRSLIEQAHRLLSDTGVFYLHLDWHAAALGRQLGDEIFGEDFFLNEIIWSYESGGRSKTTFSRKHDDILLWAKGKRYRFDLTRVPLSRGEQRRNHMKRSVDENGRAYRSIRSGGKEYRYYDDTPVYPGDVWTDISHLQQKDPERTGLATQKPLKLLDRLLRPVVNPDDRVADLTCGSGTSLAAASALGCRTLGVDLSPAMLNITRQRLDWENSLLVSPCAESPAQLSGEYQPETGMLLLTGFEAENPAFPPRHTAMDCLESWSAGFLDADGSYHPVQRFARSRQHPALTPMCLLEPHSQPVISTMDAAGDRRVYVWQEP